MHNTNNQVGLIVETNSTLNRFERIDESADLLQQGILMRMQGTFIPMDIAGNNGRWYTYNDYAPHVDSLKEKIARKELFGEIEHPQRVSVPYDLVSHRIDEVYFDKASNSWKGIISILDTEKGRHLFNIAKTGAPLYVSHRALGSMDKQTGKGIILKLITWDVTSIPSFTSAEFNNLTDAVQLNESFTFIPLYGQFLNEAEEALNDDVKTLINDKVNDIESKVNSMIQQSILINKQYTDMRLNENKDDSSSADVIKENITFNYNDKKWKVVKVGAESSECESGDEKQSIDNSVILEALNSNESAIAVEPAKIVDSIKDFITIQDYVKSYKYDDKELHINDLVNGAIALAKVGKLYNAELLDNGQKTDAAILTASQAVEMIEALSSAENINEGIIDSIKNGYQKLKSWANSDNASVTIDNVEYVLDKIDTDSVICIDADGKKCEFSFDEIESALNESNDTKLIVIYDNNKKLPISKDTIKQIVKFGIQPWLSGGINFVKKIHNEGFYNDNWPKTYAAQRKMYEDILNAKGISVIDINSEKPHSEHYIQINESTMSTELAAFLNESANTFNDVWLSRTTDIKKAGVTTAYIQKYEFLLHENATYLNFTTESGDSYVLAHCKNSLFVESLINNKNISEVFIADDKDLHAFVLDIMSGTDLYKTRLGRIAKSDFNIEKNKIMNINESNMSSEMSAFLNESSKNKKYFETYQRAYVEVSTIIEDVKDKDLVHKFKFFSNPLTEGYNDLVAYDAELSDLRELESKLRQSLDESTMSSELSAFLNESNMSPELSAFLNESSKFSAGDAITVINKNVEGYGKVFTIADFSKDNKYIVTTDGDSYHISDIDFADDDIDESTMSSELSAFLNESNMSPELSAFLNESIDATDSGNGVEIESSIDTADAQVLADEYLSIERTETVDDFLVNKAAESGLVITPETVVNVKTAVTVKQSESVINESQSLVAQFINENSQYANESNEMNILRAYMPASHQFVFSNLNESSKMLLQQQAEMYNLNESNVAEFIETRNWQQLATANVNESMQSAIAVVSNQNKYAKLLQSIKATKI